MSNIYLKVTIENKWPTQNLYFPRLKSLSPGHFFGAPTQADASEFLSNFLLQLKNQRPGSQIVCGFSIIFILNRITTL